MWLRSDVLIVRGRCITISSVLSGLWCGVRDAAFRANTTECSDYSLGTPAHAVSDPAFFETAVLSPRSEYSGVLDPILSRLNIATAAGQ